jgi:hypothetical protein
MNTLKSFVVINASDEFKILKSIMENTRMITSNISTGVVNRFNKSLFNENQK